MTDQPRPKPNRHPAIVDLVIADINDRDQLGQERYGMRLQAFNGRDGLRDAYEESIDQTFYLRLCIEERDALVRERDAYRAMVCDLLASAHPHPVEHPTMAAQWARARELLKNGPVKP